MTAKILVVDDDQAQAELTSLVLKRDGYEVQVVHDGIAALETVPEWKPDLILLDVMMPKMHGYEVCQRLRQIKVTKTTPIIMLTAKTTITDMGQGFEAGADDYITKPYQNAELVMRIQAQLRHAVRAEDEDEEREEDGKVIVVFSLKGGSGCTSLAVNLAVGLSQLWQKDVPLLDFSLPVGVCDMMLMLRPQSHLGEIIRMDMENLTYDVIESHFTLHKSGVKLLATSMDINESDLFTEGHAVTIIEKLIEKYPYIVIDTSHDFAPSTLAVLERADVVLMPVAPDISSVRNARTALKIFEQLGFDEEKIKPVVNWTFLKNGLEEDQIAKTLRYQPAAVLPHDRLWPEALNRGEPLVLNSDIAWIERFDKLMWRLSRNTERNLKPDDPSFIWQRAYKSIIKHQ